MSTLGLFVLTTASRFAPASSTNAREAGCTGEESYDTHHFDGVLRPWDGIGLAGSVPRDDKRQGPASSATRHAFSRPSFSEYKALTTPFLARLDHL